MHWKKFKVEKLAHKIMTNINWLIDFLPKGATMNGQY